MEHVVGRSRYQSELISPSLDEIVEPDNAVRVIDAFVDRLDLRALGFARVETAPTGRPPYAPGDLLKLYIHGYMNQTRSSRRLEREAARNLEVLWLIDRLRPSFKTIADFRRDHAEAIVATCREFVRFCRDQSLMGGVIAAIDGTKIGAVASRKKAVTAKTLAQRLGAVEEKIRKHLETMDEADQREAGEEERVDTKAALEALERGKREIQRRAEELAERGLSQRVEGEEEARLMRTPNHGPQVAYNAQIAVDSKNKLIAAFDLTHEGNDERQLHPMAVEASQALGVDTLTVVADAGYCNGEQGQQCAEDGIVAVVPSPAVVNTTGEDLFSRDVFAYDRANDNYRCPAGETLARFKVSRGEKKTEYRTSACGACPLKSQCTKAGQRSITRGFHEDAREAMNARAKSDPTWMKLRLSLAEHPFAAIKWMMGHPRLLVRGLRKAKSELALGVLGFNLKRTMTILGAPRLLGALEARAA
jgi:transposase